MPYGVRLYLVHEFFVLKNVETCERHCSRVHRRRRRSRFARRCGHRRTVYVRRTVCARGIMIRFALDMSYMRSHDTVEEGAL